MSIYFFFILKKNIQHLTKFGCSFFFLFYIYNQQTGLDCAFGKISANAAATSCDICNNGLYMNITGQSVCGVCKTGQFKKEQLFEGNPFDLYTCRDCDVGRYQNEKGQASCFPCIPGTYNDEKGEDVACKSCQTNTYRGNADDAIECLKCPNGWSSSTGSAVCVSSKKKKH